MKEREIRRGIKRIKKVLEIVFFKKKNEVLNSEAP